MGGKSSKVAHGDFDELEELNRRIEKASSDRHRLVLMALSANKLAEHSAKMVKMHGKLIKETDNVVAQKVLYSKTVTIKPATLKIKAKQIEELTHLERLAAECMASIEPLQRQVSELRSIFEEDAAKIQSQRDDQKAGRKSSLPVKGTPLLEALAPPEVVMTVEERDVENENERTTLMESTATREGLPPPAFNDGDAPHMNMPLTATNGDADSNRVGMAPPLSRGPSQSLMRDTSKSMMRAPSMNRGDSQNIHIHIHSTDGGPVDPGEMGAAIATAVGAA